MAGWTQTSMYLDVSGTGEWTTVGDRNVGDRNYGSAVMYAPGKVLYAGGGDPPTAAAEVIDLMLFLLNAAGVPSVAKMVTVGP